MKKIGIILLLLPYLQLFAQGVMVNTGGVIVGSSSAHMIVAGAGNLTNSGTVDFRDGNWVHFSGNSNQFISGTNPISFSNLNINSLAVNLSRNIDVRSTVNMSSGFLDLKNSTVFLSTTASITGGETNSKRIRATDASGNEGKGNGIVTITVNNPSGNVANLGVDINPVSALGITTITRGHKELQGDGAFVGNYSIYRYYDILPSNQSNINITSYSFFTDELGSQSSNSANLQLFQMVNPGVGSDYWHPQPTTVNATYVSSQITTSSRSSMLFTLGSLSSPLPVELVSFTAHCNTHGIEIKWQTASEINSDYFLLEKSTNGIDFEPLAQVAAQGNSNNLTNYKKTNENIKGTNYYRLKQYDFNGDFYVYEPIMANCDLDMEENITPIYAIEGNVLFEIVSKIDQQTELIITNSIGQLIASKKMKINNPKEVISFDNLNLAKGMYLVTMISPNKKISKPFVSCK